MLRAFFYPFLTFPCVIRSHIQDGAFCFRFLDRFVSVFYFGWVERERAWPLPRDPRPDLYFRHSDQPQLPCWNMTGFPLGIARNASNRPRTLFRPVASPWEGGKHVARSHPETVCFPFPGPFCIHVLTDRCLSVSYPGHLKKHGTVGNGENNAGSVFHMN